MTVDICCHCYISPVDQLAEDGSHNKGVVLIGTVPESRCIMVQLLKSLVNLVSRCFKSHQVSLSCRCTKVFGNPTSWMQRNRKSLPAETADLRLNDLLLQLLLLKLKLLLQLGQATPWSTSLHQTVTILLHTVTILLPYCSHTVATKARNLRTLACRSMPQHVSKSTTMLEVHHRCGPSLPHSDFLDSKIPAVGLVTTIRLEPWIHLAHPPPTKQNMNNGKYVYKLLTMIVLSKNNC